VLDWVGALDALPGQSFGRGRSLLGLIERDRSGETARPLMAELVKRSGISTLLELWPYRLIDLAGRGEARLYQVERDPGETRDLAAELPDEVQRLERAARTLRGSAGSGAPGGVEVPLEGELRRQLEALGYLDSDDGTE